MTQRFLDEMLPLRAAEILRDNHGHQAAHLSEFGLDATADDDIAGFARAHDWAVVTENVADFTAERDVMLDLPRLGASRADHRRHAGHRIAPHGPSGNHAAFECSSGTRTAPDRCASPRMPTKRVLPCPRSALRPRRACSP